NELLWFGPLFALFTGLICWVLWRCGVPTMPLTLLAIAALIVIIVYYLFPALQRPFYRGWMFSVMPIGWVISHLLLSIIYYLLLTPIGIIMRLVGYDPMKRKLEKKRETYWVARQQVRDPNRYFKQY
ncbi:MAG: SxtJ family membrane protein, partial [Planctomycetota bacterium]|nr:SxtJ family membrane protein [Planctomycetota bacterium]